MLTKNNPTRVLIITNMGVTAQKPYSGIFVRNQYETLSQHSNIITSYFEMPDSSLPPALLKMFRYPIFMFSFIRKHIFTRISYDILHVHFFFPTILLALAYKLFRKPACKIVVTFHGGDIYHYTPFKWYYRACTKFIDYAIFVSSDLQQRLTLKVPQCILSAGILDAYKPVQRSKNIDLIFVGNLDKNKGSDRLLNLLHNYTRPLSIVIAGVGSYQHKFKSLKSQHTITILGHQTPIELNELYCTTKYLINLSRNESFGLVMTEAMACGTPIICTNTDGAMTQITNNKSGFVINQNAPDFETRLITMVNYALNLNNRDYEVMSNHAVKSACTHSVSKVAKSLSTIYSELSN